MGFLGFLGLKKEEDQLVKGYRSLKKGAQQEARRRGGFLGFLEDARSAVEKVTGDPFEAALGQERGGLIGGAEDFGRGVAQGFLKTPETAVRSLSQASIDTGRAITGGKVFKDGKWVEESLDDSRKRMGVEETTKLDPVREALYGTKELQTYQKRGKGNEKVVEGSRFRDFSKELGLASIGATIASDFLGNGSGKVGKEIIEEGGEQVFKQGAKEMAKEATKQAAKKAGKKVATEFTDDVARETAEEIAKKAATTAERKILEASPEVVSGETALNSMAKEAADALMGQRKEVGGVLVDAEKGVRESSNPQWYRKFFKENGRAPNKKEVYEIAKDMLRNGDDEIRSVAEPELYQATESMLDEVKARVLGQAGGKVDDAAEQVTKGYEPTTKVSKESGNKYVTWETVDADGARRNVVYKIGKDNRKTVSIEHIDDSGQVSGVDNLGSYEDVAKKYGTKDPEEIALRASTGRVESYGKAGEPIWSTTGKLEPVPTGAAPGVPTEPQKFGFANDVTRGDEQMLALPEASPQAILDGQQSIAKAKQQFARRQNKTNMVGEGLAENAEIPLNNKLRPSAHIINLRGAGEDIADATLKRTKAGNLVPISKLNGVIVPPDVEPMVEVLQKVGSSLVNSERRIEYALKENPEMAKQLNDFVVEPRKVSVTALIDEAVVYKGKLKTLIKDMGIKGRKMRAAIQDYGEKKIDETELIARFGEEKAANIMKADEWFRTQYDELLTRMNAERAKHGKALIPRRDDYYTHIQEVSGADNIIHAKAGGINDWIQGVSNPFAKERKGGKYASDAVNSFEAYLRSALGEIHLTEPVARMESLVDAIEAKAIELGRQGDLQGMINTMRDEASALAGRPVGFDKQFLRSDLGKKTLKLLEWTRTRISRNTIVGSTSSAIMQTAAMPAAMAENGYANAVKGMMDNLAAVAKGVDVEKISPFLRRRYADTDSVIESGWRKAEKVAMIPFNFVEKTITDSIWWGSFNRANKMGLSGDDAIREADRITERIVGGRAIGEQPVAFESTIGGTLFQYQLEVNNLAKQIRNEWSPAQLARFAVSAYLFNTAMEKTTGQRPLPDAIEAGKDTYDLTKGGDIKGALGRMPAEVLSNIPGGQSVAGFLPEDVRKQYLGKTDVGRYGGNIPVGRVAEAGAKLFTDPAQGASDLITYVGTPFGGRQAKKTIEGVMAANEGASETRSGDVQFQIDKTPGEFVKAALFGKYATKGGKEYTKDALRSLSETQSERVKQIIKSQEGNPDGAEADRVVKTSVAFYQGIQRVSKDKTEANKKIKEAVERGDQAAANKYAMEYNTKLRNSLKKFRVESKQFLDENPAALKMFQDDYNKAFISTKASGFRKRVSRYQKEQELLKALGGQR